MATDLASPRALDAIQLQPADVVVNAASCTSFADVRAVASAAREALSGVRSVIVHSDGITMDGELDEAAFGSVTLLPYRVSPAIRLPLAPAAGRELLGRLADIVERTGARGCAVLGVSPNAVSPDIVSALTAPVIDRGLDLVLPSYARHRFDGLINTAIVNPLTRALYGRRVDGQLGIDFGLSSRLVLAIGRGEPSHRERPIWLLTEAAELDMRIGQAHIAASPAPVESAQDLSTALAQVLGSLFDDMERHAAIWQRTRSSQPVPVFGQAEPVVEERRSVDHLAMIESFQLGFRSLQDVWSLVLPPATLIELGRLARVAPDRFRLPPTLWARLIFDFALGYRLRVMSRDHLLRAVTPVYLAWVASFVLEVAASERAVVGETLERVGRAFESEKPYLLARWRWPDRFHP